MVRIVTSRFLVAPGGEICEDYGLAYEGGRILRVARAELCRREFPGAELRELGDCVLSPGFVNAHMHLYGTLAHGIVPPVPIESFKGFLEDYWWPLVENLLDEGMIAAATRASALELVNSGVTSLCDVLEAPLAGGGALATEAAVLESLGLRAALSSEACERISTGSGKAVLESNAAFARAYRSHGLISGLLCTHTSFTCSEEFMRFAARLASQDGLDLQLHLNESRYEPEWCSRERGLRPAEWYESIGLLGPGLIAAQGVQLSAREIELLAARQVRLVHVPLSNCEVGGGIAPVPELLAAGIACGLGTDGYINDFLEVMRGAFLIHKGHRENPAVMDAHTVWSMATEGGADVVYPGLGLGRLAAGRPADFIAVDISDLPTPANSRNLLDQLILFRTGAQVRDVVVAGRHIKRDGALLTGDLAAARAETRSQALRLWDAGRAAVATRG